MPGRHLLVDLHQLALGLFVGLPVVLADGLQHAFGHLGQRRRVGLFEPLAHAQLVAVPDVGLVKCLPLVVAHHVAVHHLPAPEVVHRVEHLQRARVALFLHLLHPAGMLVDRTQLGGHEPLRCLQPGLVGVAHVGDVELRVLAVQELHRLGDAAQVLERMVGVQQAAQVAGAREHGRVGAAQVLCVGVDLLALAVGELAAPVRRVGPVGPGHARQVEPFQLAIALVPGVGRQ